MPRPSCCSSRGDGFDEPAPGHMIDTLRLDPLVRWLEEIFGIQRAVPAVEEAAQNPPGEQIPPAVPEATAPAVYIGEEEGEIESWLV